MSPYGEWDLVSAREAEAMLLKHAEAQGVEIDEETRLRFGCHWAGRLAGYAYSAAWALCFDWKRK